MKNGQTSGIEFVETPEDLIRHVPQLKNSRDLSTWKGLWNKHAGWAHAHDAMKKLGEEVSKFCVTRSGSNTRTGSSSRRTICVGTRRHDDRP